MVIRRGRSPFRLSRRSPSRKQTRFFSSKQSPQLQTLTSLRPPYFSLNDQLLIRLSSSSSSSSTHPQLDEWDVFLAFASYCSIERIDVNRGFPVSSVELVFSAPIHPDLWALPTTWTLVNAAEAAVETYQITSTRRLEAPYIPSVMDRTWLQPARLTFPALQLDFGIKTAIDEYTFAREAAVWATDARAVLLSMEAERRELRIDFFKSDQKFRICFPFHSLEHVRRCVDPAHPNKLTLIIAQQEPMRYSRERPMSADDSPVFDQNGLRRRDLWQRAVDLSIDASQAAPGPLELNNEVQETDIGRWTVFKLVLDLERGKVSDLVTLEQILAEVNVVVKDIQPHQIQTRRLSVKDSTIPYDGLTFQVRFMLEVCMSQHLILQHCITPDFIKRLAALTDREAISRLNSVAATKMPLYDPMMLFQISYGKCALFRRLPRSCMLMRSVIVTPTKIILSAPTVEVSNRVTRTYAHLADRFLRVRFQDDKPFIKLLGRPDTSWDLLYDRVYRVLQHGLHIGGRHYQHLASGNSQFREHGAYFLAPVQEYTCDRIRFELGDFTENQLVSKFSARLGQCFSTTRAINLARNISIVELEDVRRNGFLFTDGVGTISSDLCRAIATELGPPAARTGPPSVFQFRLGGAKGVLAVDPEMPSHTIGLRRSQYKFHAAHEGIEVIRASSFVTPQLNRQLITCLSALGIHENVFLKMLTKQLTDLDASMFDGALASTLLQKRVDANHMTLVIDEIVRHGFMSFQDPFITSLINLWRCWSLKGLKEKAAIVVEKGAFLLGCTDEYNTLKGFILPQVDQQYQDLSSQVELLPEIFVQVSSPTDPTEFTVIQGLCIIARNPSLHAGDMRVVRAVDKPMLHHYKNVVVFPQSGDRDVPSMCSGGDLDGDDFFISWDPDLLPSSRYWYEPVMQQPDQQMSERVDFSKVNTQVQRFFVKHIKYDTLGLTATHWQAHADQAQLDIRNRYCEELAFLHSKAVDFPKSGVPAKMEPHLYSPHWPHYMNGGNRKPSSIYTSTTVLGKLFDRVDATDFSPHYEVEFDPRILNAFPVSAELLRAAEDLKAEYDEAITRIMSQHEIKTEFEVWSTFIMHHIKASGDYKFHEEIGRLSASLKEQFRDLCIERAGSEDFTVLGPFVVAMYTVTANQVARAKSDAQYHNTHRNEQADQLLDEIDVDGDRESSDEDSGYASPGGYRVEMPLISFPWLFHREIGRIVGGTVSTARVKAVESATPSQPRRHKNHSLLDIDLPDAASFDVITSSGVTHLGDILQLFSDDKIEGEVLEAEKKSRPIAIPTPRLASNGAYARAPEVTIQSKHVNEWTAAPANHEVLPSAPTEASASSNKEVMSPVVMTEPVKLTKQKSAFERLKALNDKFV